MEYTQQALLVLYHLLNTEQFFFPSSLLFRLVIIFLPKIKPYLKGNFILLNTVLNIFIQYSAFLSSIYLFCSLPKYTIIIYYLIQPLQILLGYEVYLRHNDGVMPRSS